MPKKYRYTQCRALGHNWESVPNRRKAPWGVLMTERCTGPCHGIRENTLDSNYDLSVRVYDLPEDYSDVPPGMTRADWRREHARETRAKLRHLKSA